ncbi:hypothetical protein ACFOY8_14270 [Thalassospira xianhensis]|uniref:Uncharacterized protein n=1 Tax=Thalassospira xianhensis MCCC 1A02616 TaxID=1177929 RepID=A0A367UI34_9PROT|nr:hypothetical protein [Thalassospira xianhensis]RCK07681.1 hypothetical protein TH5_00995 [Thalassospira xianhensis MCCC 1A02616]
MRIIYGKDYYDSALAFGQDASIVYVRNKDKMLSLDEAAKLGLTVPQWSDGLRVFDETRNHVNKFLNYYVTQKQCLRFRDVAAVVCGKIYAGVAVSLEGAYDSTDTTCVVWTEDAFSDYLAQFNLKLQKKDSRAYRRDKSVGSFFGSKPCPPTLTDYLHRNKITVMTYDSRKDLLNFTKKSEGWRVDQPTLSGIEFYKVLPPFEMMQEASMWVGGVLAASGNDTVEITDDVIKAEKHGFDKWSFRTPPSR